MVKVVYLKKGERRPSGDKSLLIECRPGLRGEELVQSSSGVTAKIRPEGLEAMIADLDEKGAKTVYVRKYGDA